MENRRWFWKWLEAFWKENGQRIIYAGFALMLGAMMIYIGMKLKIDEFVASGSTLITGVSFVLATKIRAGKIDQ